MNVYWLEQSFADVPGEDGWLGEAEILVLSRLRFAKRRSDWRLGRWTAKRALSICFGLPELHSNLAKIEVRGRPSGAPQVFFENAPAAVTISLSHSNGRGLCVIAQHAAALGCDLELVDQRSDAFVADYFTPAERAFVAGRAAHERFQLLAVLWSAKESALKALHEGLRLDTRSVPVELAGETYDCGNWKPLRVSHAHGKTFDGWWQNANSMVRTVVASPAPMSPVLLGDGDFHGGASPFLWSGSLPGARRDSPLPVAG